MNALGEAVKGALEGILRPFITLFPAYLAGRRALAATVARLKAENETLKTAVARLEAENVLLQNQRDNIVHRVDDALRLHRKHYQTSADKQD